MRDVVTGTRLSAIDPRRPELASLLGQYANAVVALRDAEREEERLRHAIQTLMESK